MKALVTGFHMPYRLSPDSKYLGLVKIPVRLNTAPASFYLWEQAAGAARVTVGVRLIFGTGE